LALPSNSGHGRHVTAGDGPFAAAPRGIGAAQMAHHIINEK
jgi:hypothetical protein